MDLEKLYLEIHEKGKNSIYARREYIDKTIDDPSDTRMGMTILIRPSAEIKNSLSKAVETIKAIEPEQYYYPQEDLHVTLLDIISAKQDFHYTDKQKESCIALCESVISKARPFKINFLGLIFSESCIMAKGFYDEEMQNIRQCLREKITDFGLSNDERYTTSSSHITISRFRNPITNRESLIQKITDFQDISFGEFEVTEAELVCHNWFDSKKELIKRLYLK